MDVFLIGSNSCPQGHVASSGLIGECKGISEVADFVPSGGFAFFLKISLEKFVDPNFVGLSLPRFRDKVWIGSSVG